ncbi:MAG: hypothetical protein RI947_283 [Candidatus Parcubacteria bacterium]|jgi:hypothetical protein
MDITHYRLKHKLDEVFILEPNDLGNGFLTMLFKKTSAFFKVMPFLYILPFSIAISCVAYVLFGALIVKLVSLLQYGF